MLIQVNGESKEIDSGSTIDKLMKDLSLSDVRGVALALNGAIVSRTEWSHHVLNNNDIVIIIQATQGG